MKYLLWPFSLLYASIAAFRNFCYKHGVFKSYHSPLKTIVIGNLQVGGSGKTPMTAYLYWMLSPQYQTAILSRGYGRKTKGLLHADKHSNAASIGDEPLWYYQTLPGVEVVVSERRAVGLKYLETCGSELVLLDDAFQHRAVSCDIQLLLSDYKKPYYLDMPMPSGRLREWPSGAQRADIIVFTKCPEQMGEMERAKFLKRCGALPHQTVFFSTLQIGNPRKMKGPLSIDKRPFKKIIALCAIANPASFTEICQRISKNCQTISFSDHHHYSLSDVKNIVQQLDEDTIVFTTEKDAVKLMQPEFLDIIPINQFYILPVQVQFLFNQEAAFEACIKQKLNDLPKQ